MAAVKCPVCHAICMFPVQSLNLSTHHVLDITGVCIKIDVSVVYCRCCTAGVFDNDNCPSSHGTAEEESYVTVAS